MDLFGIVDIWVYGRVFHSRVSAVAVGAEKLIKFIDGREDATTVGTGGNVSYRDKSTFWKCLKYGSFSWSSVFSHPLQSQNLHYPARRQ